MQKIKLLVLDLDGTLIEPAQTEISDANAAAVRRAMDAGVRVTLASGRLYPVMQRCIDQLGVTEAVVAAGGADVRRGGEVLFCDRMDDDAARGILGVAEDMGVMKYAFAGDRIYCTAADENEALFGKWTRGGRDSLRVKVCANMAELLDAARGKTQKLLLWARTPVQRAALIEALRPYEADCDFVCGDAVNIEVNKKGVNKAAAVERIAAEAGIRMDEVMAVGDSENDAALLRAAGVGVAVANAMPEAAAAAGHVTESCADDGVAKAIERFLL